MKWNSGFSIIELVVALVLACAVSALVLMTFLIGFRFNTNQIERVRTDADLRTAMMALTRELQALDAAAGDIAAASVSSITYRAMRNAQFVCRLPDPNRPRIVVSSFPAHGIRSFDPSRDSILVFAEGDPTTRDDNAWLTGAVLGTAPAGCPDGVPGVELELSRAVAAGFTGVNRGAPVLGFQMTRIRSYRDARNNTWIGLQESGSAKGWSTIQPILGPIANEDGLLFQFYDNSGTLTTVPKAIAVVSITIFGPRRSGSGIEKESAKRIRDSLTVDLVLRNNPQF